MNCCTPQTQVSPNVVQERSPRVLRTLYITLKKQSMLLYKRFEIDQDYRYSRARHGSNSCGNCARKIQTLRAASLYLHRIRTASDDRQSRRSEEGVAIRRHPRMRREAKAILGLTAEGLVSRAARESGHLGHVAGSDWVTFLYLELSQRSSEWPAKPMRK